MSEIKLKPCPFCGARPFIFCKSVIIFSTNERRVFYEIECTECFAKIDGCFDSEQEAAEAWNTRAERVGYWKQATPFVDTIECSECGYQWPEPEFASPYCPNCGARMVKG